VSACSCWRWHVSPAGNVSLDGRVSFDDYAGMDTAFFSLIPNLGWATGDINFDDYSKVDQAFFFQAAPLAGDGSEVAALPEPGTWLMAVMALLSLVRIGTRTTCVRSRNSVWQKLLPREKLP
jgi:hypothetical protein